jgi:hypothetical protein
VDLRPIDRRSQPINLSTSGNAGQVQALLAIEQAVCLPSTD